MTDKLVWTDSRSILKELWSPPATTEIGKLVEKQKELLKGLPVLPLEAVLDEMFSDGVTNWGRVLTAHCYAAMAVKRDSDVDELARILTSKLGGWIETNSW